MDKSVLRIAFLLTSTLAITAGSASAQCRPDDVFCAQLRIGPRRQEPAPVYVQPAPPPAVIVQPAPQPPPVVIVQPAPPPVVVQPAPPPVVVQPRPVVVVQAPPRQVVVQPMQPMQPMRQRVLIQDAYEPDFDMGLRFNLGTSFTPDVSMGGGNVALRLRTGTHLAFDVVTGLYGGSDYQHRSRVEVPLVADMLIFFNPGNRFQFYSVLGVGLSFAEIGGTEFTRGVSRNYLGGEAGLGIEWRMGRHFAMNLDVRGFIRGGNGSAEFVETAGGVTRSTNTSGGVYGTLGFTWYWFGMRTYQ